MELYGQEPEARLLGAFVPKLEHRSAIDVGAERGALSAALLDAGCKPVHAFEPDPANAAQLRQSFARTRAVTVHELALGAADGELELRHSVDPEGASVPYGHTVLDRPDTDEIGWQASTTVPARSLGSLVAEGVLPLRVGILKIDTEGHDLAVVAGMGDLDPDVVMVEHWTNLPHSLGPCPWSAEEMQAELRPRGFSNQAFVAHRGEFTILQWNDMEVPEGSMGNVLFLHDRVVARLLPAIVGFASSLARGAVAIGEMYARAAVERLAVIEALDATEHS